jgi:hypothetical protein
MPYKCEIGKVGATWYYFPRYEYGLYNKGGKVAKAESKLHLKYAKEGRLSFGVDAFKLPHGTFEGRHCKPLTSYSAKNLITIAADEKMIRDKIRRVRSLKEGGVRIEKRLRLPVQIYEIESVSEMGNIADKMAEKLA